MSHVVYSPSLDEVRVLVAEARAFHPAGPVLVPVFRRLFNDTLTPVLAYRRLVRGDARLSPSYLFESVYNGDQVGRYSYLAARPDAELLIRGGYATGTAGAAEEGRIETRDHSGLLARTGVGSDRLGSRAVSRDVDPLHEPARLIGDWQTVAIPGIPPYAGGWVGYVGYDAVRYLEGEVLPAPPPDDRELADIHLQLYTSCVVFDHAQKTVLAIAHAVVPSGVSDGDELEAAYVEACDRVDAMVEAIVTPHPEESLALPVGDVALAAPPPMLPVSNMGRPEDVQAGEASRAGADSGGGYQAAVRACKGYIAAGDAFQIVPSQRFRLSTRADPFDVYHALRVVNPSPYMFYLQVEGGMLVGSSPEILCRVQDGLVTSRPLAGTHRRGRTAVEDEQLGRELLADPKDIAEHVMLVDLHRNDVGRVSVPGSIRLPEVLTVERYSHVMHISSEVVGRLGTDPMSGRGLDCWDALRFTLPVGTVSGAPKVRAMQIIDELEPTRRGPYAGAVGHADFHGNMDMAIALRTMVVTPAGGGKEIGEASVAGWVVDIQAGAGIVADSDPDAEHEETVNKAAALAKSVALAEAALGR